MVIEGFEFLKQFNQIEELDLEILLDLLVNDKTKNNNYNIKKVLSNDSNSSESKGIIVHSLKNKELLMISCVSEYYEINNSGCNSVRNTLDTLNDSSKETSLSYCCRSACTDCKSCHLKALKLYKEQILKKRIMEEVQ